MIQDGCYAQEWRIQIVLEITVFSSARGTFKNTDYEQGHEANLNNYQRVIIIQTTFPD